MEKKAKGLYKLIHVSTLDNKETTVRFVDKKGNSKEKIALTEIDSFTSYFDSSEALLDFLQRLGYNFSNDRFFIEYQHNHEAKRLDLVFSDQETIKKFARNNQGKYTVEQDTLFFKYLYEMIDKYEENLEMINYLRRNNYISSWLNQNLAEYNESNGIDVESMHISLLRIKKELSQYRVIRNIEIGKKEYESQKLFKQQMEERKKTFVKQKKIKRPKNFAEGQTQLFNPDNY